MRRETIEGIGIVILLGLGLSACGGSGPTRARAELRGAGGERVGLAEFVQEEGGVRITVEVEGLPPGEHGLHLHAIGECVPPDFKAAGGHFNPAGKAHGHDNPNGHHAGDLPNLVVGADGTGRAVYLNRDITLAYGGANSLFDDDGTAVVIHAGPDDRKTDPSGASGARIACGVVEPAGR
jgi:Cu-Zn family superoxide dismutase